MHHKCLDLTAAELKVIGNTQSSHLKIFCNQCKLLTHSMSEMKAMILDLKATVERKLQNIEEFVKTPSLTPLQREELIQEAKKRSNRATNVIMYNVPEGSSADDVTAANDILECIDPIAVVTPEDVTRIGKPSGNKPRPLKLSFKRVDMAKLVLRKSSSLKNNENFSRIFVSSDKTRAQQEFFRSVQAELNERKNKGEKHLRIKYVTNIPVIQSDVNTLSGTNSSVSVINNLN